MGVLSMNISIESAKRELEVKVISIPSVTGIGIVTKGDTSAIEIAISEESGRELVNEFLDEYTYKGHPVDIIIRGLASPLNS